MVVTCLLTATLLSITPVFAKAIPAVITKNEHFSTLTTSSAPLSTRSQVPLSARSPQGPLTITPAPPSANNFVTGYPVCNVTGFTSVPGDYTQYTYRNSNTSIYQCRAACKKDPRCESYSYNALYAGCWFYNKQVQYTQLNADDTSAFAHFDTVCELPRSSAKPECYDQWEGCMDACADDCADNCLDNECEAPKDCEDSCEAPKDCEDSCGAPKAYETSCDDEEHSEGQDTCVHHEGNTDEETDEDGWDTENDKATHVEHHCGAGEESDNDGWDTENDQAYNCSCGSKKL